jgi:hypothetical protein
MFRFDNGESRQAGLFEQRVGHLENTRSDCLTRAILTRSRALRQAG